MGDIANNLEQIRAQISNVTERPVEILGAAKYQPFAKVEESIQAGISHLGCNYFQEGEKLRKEFQDAKVTWHFIGHIQSRKAKLLLDYDCIQSVDRFKVALAINEKAKELGKTQSILIEVNIGEEPQKSGVLPSKLEDLMRELEPLDHLEIEGLMGMPPALEPIEKRRPYFKKLMSLFEQYPNFKVLSMGTTQDYLIAVEEGATMIRLGTCLFGDRPAR